MIRILSFDAVAPQDILNRDIRAEADVEAVVDGIIADVRARGDAALRDYAKAYAGKIAPPEALIACFAQRGAYAEGIFTSFLDGTCVI